MKIYNEFRKLVALAKRHLSGCFLLFASKFWELVGTYVQYFFIIECSLSGWVLGTFEPYLLQSNLYGHFALTDDRNAKTSLLDLLPPSYQFTPQSNLVKVSQHLIH